MTHDNFWSSKPLRNFLSCSNEDQVYAEYINRKFGNLSGKTIVDIGSGPGTKIHKVISQSSPGKLVLVEPDSLWAPDLIQIKKNFQNTSVLNLEMSDQTVLDEAMFADFVFCCQVVYTESTSRQLRTLLEKLKGKNITVLVTAESEDSDLAKLRLSLSNRLGLKPARSHLHDVRHFLNENRFDTSIETIGGQFFRLSSKEMKLNWFIDFVMGYKSNDYSLDREHRHFFEASVIELLEKNQGKLHIPDTALIVRT